MGRSGGQFGEARRRVLPQPAVQGHCARSYDGARQRLARQLATRTLRYFRCPTSWEPISSPTVNPKTWHAESDPTPTRKSSASKPEELTAATTTRTRKVEA
eukprot:5030986-Pyramimonas_sp.AAC.1